MSGPWKYVNYTIEWSSKNPVSGTTNYSSIPGLADWIIGLRLDYDDFLKFEFEEYLFNNATWLLDCLKRAYLEVTGIPANKLLIARTVLK